MMEVVDVVQETKHLMFGVKAHAENSLNELEMFIASRQDRTFTFVNDRES